ncbi:uncharacterized protein [Blastocystis hominis]|uniref:Uncharacterized protein n=1 Tax=Blastocystis hominis TaxID=12968 RepID=D8LVZ9_BLAHO|nr:uncharacterized protein [Blastocystis hominis]CBK19988.2 unnamed protein product [Blastocystis hominis]|eukprot:XP_012894036.1 uncharacterized protein [Blastocystis hominis]
MSSQSGQIVQYKDVLKLMKKKLQIAETQTTEIKSKYDALEATMIGFLEYVTKPFSESNPQPDLTSVALRCWWDVKKEGLFLEEKKTASLDSVSQLDSNAAACQSRIVELTADIQKIEFEKRDLEYNLDKRNTDYKSMCQEHEQLQSEYNKTQKQLEESTARVSELEAIISAARNQITSLFISISQYLDVNSEREDEIKPLLYAAIRQIFPSSLSQSAESSLDSSIDDAAEAPNESSTESSTNEVELMLLSTVDKISLLKSRYHAIQQEIAIKSDSLASQSQQIADLLAVSDQDRATIAKLRLALEKAQSSTPSSVAAAQTDRDSQLSELEKTNSALRAALQSMKASVEQQQRQVNESEARMVQMQNELVEESASEAAALHVLLEQTTKQYDQELTVLRERKYAVEQQVTVSERFLDSSNRAHREELSKLTVSLQEAQKECDALRIQIMEKESELRTAVDNYESLRVQATEQMKEVTHQMMEMKARMKEEKEKFDREKESLQLSEHNMHSVIAEKVSAAEQKQKESAREQQRQFEEEVGEKESG